ncbi:GATA domain-containing protein [Cephalotus follicularis]|uniref:GATA domain-containing protein n=1 Tax=Cephalotus follicularis TaxID=3775 RepID=A0A1Q3C8N3_CEPFO|nr:GATA domain-containing protein [Cephalotus follicularis]
MDDLLDFALDIGEEDKPTKKVVVFPSVCPVDHQEHPDDPGRSVTENAEEELEWLSNKDAFPAVETLVDILSDNPGSLSKHRSPISVLENTTTSSNRNSTMMSCCGSICVPVRPRSKRRRKCRSHLFGQESWWTQDNATKVKQAVTTAAIGSKCLHCGAESTPQWRAGPMGPKTLCNACGVRYKSGRLVPEYRPASSPTFSSKLHSNSHRKVIEMRRKKLTMGMVLVKPVDQG